MSQQSESSISVRLDPTNPGQFFACCGLLELSDRLWGGAEGWFEDGAFAIRLQSEINSEKANLGSLMRQLSGARLQQIDQGDDFASPIYTPLPFGLRVDWWNDSRSGGSRLKVWAGSMRGIRVARAMQAVLQRPQLHNDRLLDYASVVYDPLEPDKKVEPFYFDARRGASAQSIDIGFAPDALVMTSAAYPAVEVLCLIGLQRCRPMPTNLPRVFDYYTWSHPLEARLAPAAV